ncbi:MAG: hypothetical protein ACKO2Y_05000 [Actinomycetota bacterium]
MSRKASDGDTAPDLEPEAIAAFTAGEQAESANEVLLNTVREALANADPTDL